VTGGLSYLVGEVGPELFVPATDGYIVPNSALGAGRGETHLHFHVSGNTILGDDVHITRQLARILKPELDAVVGMR
jgi:phage-related minor tail protein